MKTEALIAAYREAALRHGAATKNGPPRVANRAHDRIVKLSHEVRRGGPDIQQAFMVLLKDEDPWVRCWAAIHTLEFAPDEATRVLQELAAGPRGLARLNAELLLEKWEAGTLELP